MKLPRQSRRFRAGLACVVLALCASQARAEDISARRSRLTTLTAGARLAKARAHGGKSARARDGGGPSITYTGFHVFEDGRSRIFVKLSSEVPVEARYAGKNIEFVFRGARIPLKNNKNPLITEHFPAAIVSARYAADKKGKGRDKSPDARLEIVLREESRPVHRVERMGDGTAVFLLDLPKPSTPPPPAPDPVPPSPKRGRGAQPAPESGPGPG